MNLKQNKTKNNTYTERERGRQSRYLNIVMESVDQQFFDACLRDVTCTRNKAIFSTKNTIVCFLVVFLITLL